MKFLKKVWKAEILTLILLYHDIVFLRKSNENNVFKTKMIKGIII